MNGSLQSEHWYRVANLRPFLRYSAQVARHEYRGQPWYMMRDPTSGEYRRVNQIGYDLVKHLDGRRSLDEIYQQLLNDLGEHAPGQPEIIQAVSQMAEAGLLQTDVPSDLNVLKYQAGSRRRQLLKSRVNPLSFQVAVVDPTRLLEALESVGRFMLGRGGITLWLALMAVAAVTALSALAELTAALSGSHSDARFLFLIWLVYPVLKLIHEISHGLAIRHYGGEVPEIGIRLLVLMPVPYVDGSASTLFSRKIERMVVAGAGIATELAAAGLALIFWVLIEPGLIQDILLAVIVVGAVSTVFFNGNPLMKFDGYYVMSDWLELPNLAERAKRSFVSWVQRTLLRLHHLPPPHVAPGESRWLMSYAIASWSYRSMIMFLIAMFIGEYSLLAAAMVVAIAAWTLVLSPALNAFTFLWISPVLNGRRAGTVALAAVLTGLVVGLVVVPAPSTTVATGIVWLADNANVRTHVAGNIEKIHLHDGQQISRGQPVFTLSNPEVVLKKKQLVSELSALRTEQVQYLNAGSKKAMLIRDQIAQTTKALDQASRRVEELTVTANADGTLVLPAEQDLTGAWMDAGDVAGYVLGSGSTLVRVALPNRYADKVKNGTQAISVRFSEDPDRTWTATIAGEQPAGSTRLPGPALSAHHGGPILTRPDDAQIATEPVFLIDVEVSDRATVRAHGRAQVRFDHPNEPIVSQAAAAFRSLFLRQFNS